MNKAAYAFLVFFFVALTGVPVLYAVDEGFVQASDQAAEDEADPSAFDGDSNDMPGERAPEDMPMDDEPVDGGVGVEI